MIANLGPPIPESRLERRSSLPAKPAPVVLEGRLVTPRPMVVEQDAEALHRVSNGDAFELGGRTVGAYDPDGVIWRYMSGGPFGSADELAAWHQALVNAADGLCFCAIDVATGHPVGSASLMANSPGHLKVELGSIWYSPIVQRSGINVEATLLMLQHVFDLGYRRVEWKCDTLNERSRRAAMRMGFRFEGIQQYHYAIKGRSRDTAWFRMLDHEWPAVRPRLEALLPH
jgi:RimJ/RimL family protein N-acetyltransferase